MSVWTHSPAVAGRGADRARRLLLLLGLVTAGFTWSGPARAQESAGAVCTALAREVGGLRLELAALQLALKRRDDALEDWQRDTRTDLGALKERVATFAAQPLLSAAFLTSPPPSSDSLGVAKAPVFAPRLTVDSVRRHDTLFVKLRRIEPAGVKLVAELELAGSEPTLELPVDQNGALYVLEWSTSEGFNYTLALRDGAADQTAASVQVRPLQNQGRFLYVASRLE